MLIPIALHGRQSSFISSARAFLREMGVSGKYFISSLPILECISCLCQKQFEKLEVARKKGRKRNTKKLAKNSSWLVVSDFTPTPLAPQIRLQLRYRLPPSQRHECRRSLIRIRQLFSSYNTDSTARMEITTSHDCCFPLLSLQSSTVTTSFINIPTNDLTPYFAFQHNT